MLIGTEQMISKHSVNFTVSFIGKTLMAVESARDLGVYLTIIPRGRVGYEMIDRSWL